MLPVDALESTLKGEFRNDIASAIRSQEDKGTLLHSLKKQLERLGSLDAGIGVLDNDDIVGRRTAVPCAMREAGNRIGGNNELPFFEFQQAGIDHARITMNEKNAEGTASVDRVIFRTHGFQIRLSHALVLFCHGALNPGSAAQETKERKGIWERGPLAKNNTQESNESL